MVFALFDRVRETSTTTGTGNLTLAGAVSDYRSFSSVYSNNDTFLYCITSQNGTQWETGIGTFVSATPAINRTTVKSSSNANALVNFTGPTFVFVSLIAYQMAGLTSTGAIVSTDATQNLVNKSLLTNSCALVDATDNTKEFAFNCSGNGTGAFTQFVSVNAVNANMTLPPATTTLVGTDATQTLTNKTIAATGTITGSANSASALAIGLNGATNPAFAVDTSTASSATGIKVKSAAAAGGVAISVTSSGAAENLKIDALGTGTITVGGTSTGAITMTRATTFSAGATMSSTLVMGANSITMTGSLAATGARVTKGWFTDIESTNAPTIGGVAATGSGGLVRATSPTFVTPILGAASATNINFGGTSLANYVESTFTPVITGSGTAGTGTYTNQIGSYTRIGNRVFGSARVTTTSHTGTGGVQVSLPIVSAATYYHAVTLHSIGQAPSTSGVFEAFIAPSSSVATVVNYSIVTGAVSTQNISSAFDLVYTFNYQV